MKKEDLPQDSSALRDVTREVCYVKDDDGKYGQSLSTGWKVKADALDEAWADINDRVREAAEEVKSGKKSPVLFFMEVNIMDYPTLSGYTGFWKWTIKRHIKPSVFKKLSDKKLGKYAAAFKISVEELKRFDGGNIDKYIRK
ncbi:hypothetical protein LVD15_02585 [Fulvivirga maritima]|uniref:hypothetical protein n=1 Tax=Fulvivirga maritima TaxID=2904247 RepID=UPI001F325CCE|nr:hypothetical protein [Fulvivirga maritima]UII27334.1 hypothetical protein LVD15_02585 [Fulvivirga maritima]